MTRSPTTPAQVRACAATLVLTLVAIALAVGYWAQEALPSSPIPLPVLELRLAFNRGVAFSLGNSLPLWVIVAVTATITAGLAVYGWRSAGRGNRVTTVALALILAGALSNVLDRIVDGAVTDYFHTGWWPTFNLADVYITIGVVLLIGASFFVRDGAELQRGSERTGP
ncbi:signal peptidase II [Rhodococcus sp. 06-1059B-a]|nr:signal peptidase II [Rhodococcus sp. 06-1059B-a]OZD70506.1 signal peptidase II [Rhodococcus sp. 06-1059B-a]